MPVAFRRDAIVRVLENPSAPPDPGALPFECIDAIPAERREPAILEALRRGSPSNVHRDGLVLLTRYPSAELVNLIETSLASSDDKPKRFKAALKALAPAGVASARKADALTCLALTKPKAVTALDEVQQNQLRIACERWDGKALPAKDRLASGGMETSVRATLEIRLLGDAKGPRYDALTFAGDSGTVFTTGTTKVVADLEQGSLVCKDAALREALVEVIDAKPRKR